MPARLKRAPEITSRIMRAVRSADSKAELLLRRALHARGFRYRLHSRTLPGKPDIVFTRTRVVVFVDGDFWHARVLREEGPVALRHAVRGARQKWWVSKLKRNAARDEEVNVLLARLGWKVVRVWESDVQRDVEKVAERVARLLRRRQR